MSGQTYSDLKAEDPCWVIVGTANSPTGYWRGKVVSTEEHSEYKQVIAVIKDKDVPRGYEGKEPVVNYLVVPSSRDIDMLVGTIKGLEGILASTRHDHKVAVETLNNALAYAAKLSAEELKELLGKK